jgi:hypothetical protein
LSIPGIASARLVRRGDYSSLYRGVQERFERVVAVKVFVGRTVDPDARVRFDRECAALGVLSGHPHVATVFDAGITRKRPYIVREWLPAGSLHERLATSGALTWPEAVDVGVKLAGALESLHRAGILHRNMKPQNVFLSAFGDPLVADVEMAAADRAFVTRGGDTYDTEVHAAPELFKHATPSAATDVYALTSVLATLVLGRPPFLSDDDESLVRVTARKAGEDPPDLTALGVPPEVTEVLAQGMARLPTARPATARDLGRLLQAAQRACGQPPTRLVVVPETDQDRVGPLAAAQAGRGVPAAPGAASPPVPAAPSAPAAAAAARRAHDVTAGPLVDQVRALLHLAIGTYQGRASQVRLAEAQARLDEPLRVALAGPAGSGKSTLLDALLGEELAAAQGEGWAVPVWYTDGRAYQAVAHMRSGGTAELAIQRHGGRVVIARDGVDPGQVDRLVVTWPSSSLAAMTLIDAPAVDGARAPSALEQADAVVYVLAQLRADDVALLEALQADTATGPNPIGTMAVLSRADEMGMEGADAMEVAGRIAAGWRKDPALRRLCHDVVPVAALLARGAATLDSDDHRALGLLAALPRRALESSLATAATFADPARAGRPTPPERQRLLDRFGRYGIRVAVAALRARPASSAEELAVAMTRRSGLEGLRGLLSSRFAARRDLLKAAVVLATVAGVLHDDRAPGGDEVAWALERVQAGAHEFAEVRLLNATRSHRVSFRADEADEVDRLLGVDGPSAAARLGLAAGTGTDQLAEALAAAITRWRARAESPMSSRAEAEAAGILVRTCEGLLAPLLVHGQP